LLKLFKARRRSEILKSIKSETELKERIHSYRSQILKSSFKILLIPLLAFLFNLLFPTVQSFLPYWTVLPLLLVIFFLNNLVHQVLESSICRDVLIEANNRYQVYHKLIHSSNMVQHKNFIDKLHSSLKVERCVYIRKQCNEYLDILTIHLETLEHKERLRDLKNCFKKMQTTNLQKITQMLNEHPLMRIKEQLSSTLGKLKERKKEIQEQWELAYKDFSWWNKFMQSGGPDLTRIDKDMSEITKLNSAFNCKHREDLDKLQKGHSKALSRGDHRLKYAYNDVKKRIMNDKEIGIKSDDLLQKAFLCSTFSASVSVWDDFSRAGDIYDSLRKVNQNFAGMGDTEIWWETLWMSNNSLEGLTNLTKGAYFEQLVAKDTGGTLFEHFNHEGTDIVIDGVEVQLKATDSISYIDSVDPDIPVIATSEIAEKTDAIDSGFSNEELTDSIDLALGGTVFDTVDTVADSILAGLGGLGFFATIRGIRHAADKYDKGGNGVEAIFEGAGVVIVGTAKGMVDTGELLYKTATSKPFRFVGRNLYGASNWLARGLFRISRDASNN
jgi:hypothetical protein